MAYSLASRKRKKRCVYILSCIFFRVYSFVWGSKIWMKMPLWHILWSLHIWNDLTISPFVQICYKLYRCVSQHVASFRWDLNLSSYIHITRAFLLILHLFTQSFPHNLSQFFHFRMRGLFSHKIIINTHIKTYIYILSTTRMNFPRR